MLDTRRQNSIRNQMKKSERKGCRRASAVLLATVTALSPLSVHGAMLSGLLTAPDASVVMSADADTAEPAAAEESAPSSPQDTEEKIQETKEETTEDTTEETTEVTDAETKETPAADPEPSSDSARAEEVTEEAEPAETVEDTAAEDSSSSFIPETEETAAQTAAPVETAEPAETVEHEEITEQDSSESSAGREIYVHLADTPQDPVPAKVMDTDTASLLKLISEGLVVLDENNRPAPGCAESWEVSKDGLTWTFHLRKDLRWSDGFSMKASDFVSLFRNIADTATEALYGRQLTQNIAGYEDVLNGDTSALQVHAPDDRTFVVELTTPDPEFARTCASWSLLPLREQVREDFDSNVPSDWNFATGNGPYYVDSVVYGKEVILKKNPYYRQAGTKDESADGTASAEQSSDSRGTAFDTVHWIVDGDINEEYSNFLNGNLDAISAIPEEEEILLEADNLVQKKSLPDTMGICFNCRHEVLGDSRVRKALSMAVDRTFIASTILQDVYQPEGGESLNGQGGAEDYMAEAKKLLEEAGYKDGEGIPVLTLIADEKGGALLTAEYLASVWRDLGINVRVEAENASDLAQEKKAGTFDIFCGSIFLASDLPNAELAGFTTDHENNISGFSLEEYDNLIEKASAISDEKEYAEVLGKAFDILREQTPVTPLVTRCVSWLRKDKYPGIRCDSTGCWQLNDIQQENAENTVSNGLVSGDSAASDNAYAAENPDGSMAVISGVSGSAGRSGSQRKGISVTAQMPAGRTAAVQSGSPEMLPQIKSTGSERLTSQSSTKAASNLDFIRTSDFYFERTSQAAYLTRQAWVYDAIGENAQRITSLPKYSEVHQTGTGNSRLVRITQDGKFRYLESNRVSADTGVIEEIRTEERRGLAEKAVLTASLHSVKQSELGDRAADARAKTEEIQAEIARREMLRKQTKNPNWDGPVLSRAAGSVKGPSGKETYYNLDMSGVISIMRHMGNTDEYWVRDDGCKMLGDYIMCAANLRVHPRGSLVESSLGTCIVCDTGGFASHNSNQLDIAVTW